MDWLRKPAIQWNAQFIPSDDASCPYWNRELIGLLSSLDINGETKNKNDDECSISYGSLIMTAISVAHFLRQCLYEIMRPIDPPPELQNVGVSVVVAIPEGPLLPIAVLVVHLLNEPTIVKNASTRPFAVLVPLEPGEGKERLRHMLVDLRPALILCLSGNDSERLSDILASMEPAETTVTSDGLLRPALSELVDFGELVRGTIETIAMEENGSLKERICHYFDECNDELQSILPAISISERNMYCNTANETQPSSGNRISHVVFTSGTTGLPKGCVSSIESLRHYLAVKNEAHQITSESVVLLASALSFDPCLSDILATLEARATLVIAPRAALIQSLPMVLQQSLTTNVLCTPTLWGMVHSAGVRPSDLPSLQVVALGGEVIPKHIVKAWARDKSQAECKTSSELRLCSTYGVTEACVYQTFGEVFQDDDTPGQNVGKPLRGLAVRIRRECNSGEGEALMPRDSSKEVPSGLGEIVLSGKQIDKYSSYLNRKQLSSAQFVKASMVEPGDSNNDKQECYCYLTGDRGYVNSLTNDVHIMGRIQGEDGMVKVNGVRVELGEIESALVDDALVTGCLAVDREMDNGSKQIHAFCILSRQGRLEIGLYGVIALESGVLLSTGPLLLLLRARCTERVRAGVIPSHFIIIERIPLSPTGKRDRRQLPQLSECVLLDSLRDTSPDTVSKSLWEYGSSGATVAEQVVDCLNLQPCQRPLLTTDMSFGMLGGDSLAATRLVRALYACHNGVFNSRFLGGQYGVLEGPFATSYLLRARTMGEYVDWLDSNGVCGSTAQVNGNGQTVAADSQAEVSAGVNDGILNNDDSENDASFQLYEALLEAVTSGQSLIACALLDDGVDPNLGQHGGRLGKTCGRHERKETFRSNPLHLACSKGDEVLAKKLLEKGCKFNSPDAAGSFPIHLAASSTNTSRNDADESTCTLDVNTNSDADEDCRRYECVKALLDAGAPLTMKDGNKQTVLHCAARAGHCKLLRYLMQCWASVGKGTDTKNNKKNNLKLRDVPYDWRDRWFRTPVHWAVLNGKVKALQVLLEGGCSPDPPKPKSNRRTSVAMESPLEICDRLYSDSANNTGRQMRELLLSGACKCCSE